MAYIETEWKDQKVEKPKTYELQNNPDGTTTLIDSFGVVTELGTPVNAEHMNHIEKGIAGTAIRLHNMTEVFAKDEWVKSGDKLYKSKQDQNKGHAVTEPEWYSEVSLGGGLPVGSIFAHSASASFVPENSVPCDGMEYSKDQFKALYNDFLVLKRLETCTYEEYQQDVTTNGACAKFGIDTAKGMFKVPLIPDGYYIKKGQGTSNKAGLPNITGGIIVGPLSEQVPASGCVYKAWETSPGNLGGGSNRAGYGIDASRSNPIYGASDTVETNAVAYRYFVVVATGSIKQSEMDWSAWASSLQGKANIDGDNFSKLGKELISGLGMPSGKYIDLSFPQTGSILTAPANGYYYLQKQAGIGNRLIEFVNKKNQLTSRAVGADGVVTLKIWIMVQKGENIELLYNATGETKCFRFIYAEGSKE